MSTGSGTPDAREREYEALTAALGWAITRWATVEDSLCGLFAQMVAGDSRASRARSAFDAVPGFLAKLNMTVAVARWHTAGFDRVAWDALYGRLKSESTKRNHLAHFTIIKVSPPERDGRTYSLSPQVGNIEALVKFKGNPPRYSARQLRAMGESFTALAADLDRFVASLRPAAVQPPEPPPASRQS
jgi:hypothetical protein